MSTRATGIRQVHSRRCPRRSDRDARCRCSPSYEAAVWDAAAGRRLRRTFRTERAAKAWKADTTSGINRGQITAALGPTVREAGEALVAGMRAGSVRNRSGRPFKPSVVEGYEASLVQWVYADLGARRLGDVRRQHVQALADRLVAEGKQPSTVRNVLMPLRVVFRRAIRDGVVSVNPTSGLDLPAGGGRRDRFATPAEAAALLAALDAGDRAAWGLALYAGLRLGEVRALEWADVDLDAGELHVRHAWCNRTKQMTAPKTLAAERTVPIAGELRRILLAHRMQTGRVAGGLVISRRGGGVETADAISDRAESAWKSARLDPLTMHEARHTYASLMILAGVPITALARFMGHTSITTTVDRYGHLYPSERRTAAAALDALLADLG
jgi:integrase